MAENPQLVPEGQQVTAALVSDSGTWTSGPSLCFRAASVTKTFVAAAVLVLAERAVLRLDASVDDLLDDDLLEPMLAAGYDTAHMTLEHLLGHRAGLPDHSSADAFHLAVRAEPERRWTRGEQVAIALDEGPPLCPPGEGVHYSDTGYVLIGAAVERVTERRLGDVVAEALELPRRTPDTTWEYAELEGARFPQQLDGLSVWDIDASADLHGGGGLVTTAHDLAVFARDLLTVGILAPESLELMLGRGLGIMRAPGEVELWGHLGFWGTAMLGSRTGTGIGVAVSPATSAGGSDPGLVALRLHEIAPVASR